MDREAKARIETIKSMIETIKAERAELDSLVIAYPKLQETFEQMDKFIIRKQQEIAIIERELEESEELPKIKSTLPNKLLIANTKIQDKTFAEYNEETTLINQEQQIKVGRENKADIIIKGELELVKEEITMMQEDKDRLTAFDRLAEFPHFCSNILDAIMSIIQARINWEPGAPYSFDSGGPTFTAQDIYKVLVHDKTKSARSGMTELINKAIQTMGFIEIHYDLTEQWNQENKNNLRNCFDSVRYSEKMLMLGRIDAMKNGKKVTAFQVLRIPPFMRYAIATKQVLTTGIEDIPALSRASMQQINIQRYLLRQILDTKGRKERQRNKKQGVNYIDRLYDTILRNSDISPKALTKVALKKHQDNICEMLEDFKNHGMIKNFEEIGENGRKNGRYKVRIYF